MKTVSKIALVATFGLALAFTFSCSKDDDKGGGGWLTCEEAESIVEKCNNKYRAEQEACVDSDCDKAVSAKIDNCWIPDVCNGTSKSDCKAHYKSECDG